MNRCKIYCHSLKVFLSSKLKLNLGIISTTFNPRNVITQHSLARRRRRWRRTNGNSNKLAVKDSAQSSSIYVRSLCVFFILVIGIDRLCYSPSSSDSTVPSCFVDELTLRLRNAPQSFCIFLLFILETSSSRFRSSLFRDKYSKLQICCLRSIHPDLLNSTHSLTRGVELLLLFL